MLTDARVAAIKPPAAGQEEHRDTKVTGLRLRVGAGGKKSWIVRARAGGKVVNKKLGSYPLMGLKAARKAAEELLEAIAKDGSGEAARRTFGDVADAWLEKKRADRKRNRSVGLQQRRLELHVLPKWRERRIGELKRRDVRDLVESIEGDVLPNRVLTVVRTIFRFALSRDWIEASPAEGIAKPKDETERDRFLDMTEAKRVWHAADLLGYPAGPYIRALMLTGQRRTEVASMRWSDVDEDAATWTLKAADTKGERAHLVPLSTPMLALINALPPLGDFVFTTNGETHFSDYAKLKSRVDKFVAISGDPIEPWTLHDLRRTAATHMVRLGVSEEVVGRVLNHAPKGVTAKVYALHSYAPEKRSALDRWAAELMRAVEREPVSKVVGIRG